MSKGVRIEGELRKGRRRGRKGDGSTNLLDGETRSSKETAGNDPALVAVGIESSVSSTEGTAGKKTRLQLEKTAKRP